MFKADQLHQDILLAPLTTIGVGGRALGFWLASNRESLCRLLLLARRGGVPALLLGGGSNVVFPDEGFAGYVVRPVFDDFSVEDLGDRVRLRVGAGMNWDALVALCVARGWAGVECLSGIPGLVGAAPIQNVGAYGQEVAQTIESVEVITCDNAKSYTFSADECLFAYRQSRFKAQRDCWVTGVTFVLPKGRLGTVAYPDLEREIGEAAPTLSRIREAVLKVRRAKSMVFDLKDPNSRGCGSFFTNPILTREAYVDFVQRVDGDHPHFRLKDGRVKLVAAWLIERSGFGKGYRFGNAGLSQKHCLAIINPGDASASDVIGLASKIQAGVRSHFGVVLEPEPHIVNWEGLR